ncbi:MAG: hypothetical protein QOH64_240 [Acidimicrobiaceae bacterium]
MSDMGAGKIDLGIPGIEDVVLIGQSLSHTTYRVRDAASGRTVIVKVLNGSASTPGLAERFGREQDAMAELAPHPNIVTVFGHGFTSSGQPYIVTDEVAGGSIADRLRGPTPMTGPDILSLGIRLAGALESAHRSGVVHGDLRPDDMLVDTAGEPLIADFGVVSLVGPTVANADSPGRLAHAAPELLDGQSPTPSTDIYALASALYTLFAGQPAFVHPGETAVIPVIKRIATDPAPDLTAKGVPGGVAQVIDRAMSKAPAERHANAQELGRALQQAQVSLGLGMTDMAVLSPASFTPTVAAPVQPAAAPPSGPSGPPPGPSGPPPGGPAPGGGSSKTPLFIGIGVVVVVALIAVFLLTRSDDKKAAVATKSKAASTDSTDVTSSGSTSSTDFTSDFTSDFSTSSSSPIVDADGNELIRNDSGQISVRVPAFWTQRDPTPFASGTPKIDASTDLARLFAADYGVPGVEISAFSPAQIDPSNLDAVLDLALTTDRVGGPLVNICQRGQRIDFVPADGLVFGRIERLTTCNNQGTVEMIVATDPGRTFTALVEVHLVTPADEPGLASIKATFSITNFP